MALYVRDAFRFPVGDDPTAPPPLAGEVDDRSGMMGTERRRQAGSQWVAWWERILRLEGARSLRTLRLPEEADPLKVMPAVHASLFDWPALDALSLWPELQGAVRECGDDAVRWAGGRKQVLVVHDLLARGRGGVPLKEIAERIVQESRVGPGLVRAAIFLLGVQGAWSALASPGVMLCSPSFAQDSERLAVLAEQALASGPDAEEVGVKYEPKRLTLPPSALSEPLVLWRRGDASLSCERVVPYGDGFEIELRRRGLGAPIHQWRPGRRRPSSFAGLQLHLHYADGRGEFLDDVERLDRTGLVTITPFTREAPDSDVLWLWVMPLPPAGEVRLTVEWSTQGVEPVTVMFDGALIRPQRPT